MSVVSERNGRVVSRRARAVYANTGPVVRTRGRSRSRPRVVEVKRARSSSARRPSVVRMKSQSIPSDLKPIVNSSTVEAARAVMGTMFPAKYRNATAPGENLNAPTVSHTTTDRFTVSTVADGAGVFSQILTINPTLDTHVTYAGSFANGVVASTLVYDSSFSTAALANIHSYRVTGLEVRIEPNVASANIQGEWSAYCYPYTGIGVSVNSLATAPQAARGFFTDANPSLRYVWFKGSENDDDQHDTGVAPTANDTAIYVTLQTQAATPFVLYITTTWTFIPTLIGQYLIPGAPTNVDESAYRRGMQAFGDAVNENTAIITSPLEADKNHNGILSKVARAIANTVAEARDIVRAVAGAAAAGKSAMMYGMAIAESLGMHAEVLRAVVNLATPETLAKLKQESKSLDIPPAVLEAFAVLANYSLTFKHRRAVWSSDVMSVSEPYIHLPTERIPSSRRM